MAALLSGQGALRVPMALLLALAVALPFVALSVLEGRAWDRGLHWRLGQLEAMRATAAWQEETSWEIADRIGLLLRFEGARIDYIPHWVDAEDAFFSVIGSRGRGLLAVRIVRQEALTRDGVALAVGRAALGGVGDLLIVALSDVDPLALTTAEHGGGGVHVEIWRVPDLLERAGEHSQVG